MKPLLAILFAAVALTGCNAEYFRNGKHFIRNRERLNSHLATDVKTFWFNQTLNHFDPSDTRTWLQRYFINDTFYKDGGPIFLMIGGEGEANPIWMKYGAWIDYAEKLGAYCIQLEHRFYGKSHPTEDLSVKNLEFLTSEQALADLASFTAAMKIHFPENKWVAFGGSYPGSLAAWYRLKYPHLVDISVSSSAPLVAQLDFKEYLGVVEAAINRTNVGCISQIRSAVNSLEQLLRRPLGWKMIQKKFNLCDDFHGDNRKDVANLFETLAGNFMDIVQYNEDNRAFEGSRTANISVSTLCNIMTSDAKKPAIDKYAEVNDLMLNALEENCTDYKYSKSVKDMQQEIWNSSAASGGRQWTFQTCTEFGFFQSSDLDGQPFGNNFPIDFSTRECRDVYGSKYSDEFINKAIDWSNANYGGKNLKVTRVIFINGSIDPWHALGLTNQNDTSSDNVVIFIDGTAHCANMYPASENDSQELKDARATILKTLTEWLKE